MVPTEDSQDNAAQSPATNEVASSSSSIEPIYAKSLSTECLRQGEIITGLIQLKVVLETITLDSQVNDQVTHPYVIIVTQDCDLMQAYDLHTRLNQPINNFLSNILFCEVTTAEGLRGTVAKGSDIWKRIKANKDERYQFLEKAPAEYDAENTGLPELGIDFKRYFCMPTDEVLFRIQNGAKRRCRLVSPYLEHFSTRFCYFQFRVALPTEHISE